jgi:CheY-like chemotaxis protein/HPt (histidine-containing phosphotransfer) domain-containing protein
MGGAIGVTSEIGQGSTFWFTARLPCTTPQPALPPVTATPIVPQRILVADDNAINQVIVEGLLRRDGHHVELVGDGAAALSAVQRGDFDLVLMDMQMPIMDGVEATRRIRALPKPTGAISIVALTANAMADQVAACRDAGMNDHLAKPIDRELLRRAVATFGRTTVPDVTIAGVPIAKTDGLPAPGSTNVGDLLEIFEGDGPAVAALLETAVETIRSDATRLTRAIERHDREETIDAAHRIKGTSGSIHAEPLRAIAGAIESEARNEPPRYAVRRLVELRAALGELAGDVALQTAHLRERDFTP